MNLFVTGATGFVGQHLLREKTFRKKFKKIYCLSRKKRKKIKNSNIYFIKGNLKKNYKSYFKKSDCLLHMAAHSANRPYDNLSNCFKLNCLHPHSLINNAYKAGIKKFIFIGTYHEYGFAGQIHKNKKTSVNSLCLPISTYALSKSFFFQTIFSWSLNKDVSIKYLRFPHVYGEGELKTRLWPQIKKESSKIIYLNNPNFKTNFINIKKLIFQLNKHINLKNIKKNFFEVINIVDKNMTLYQFAIKEKNKFKSKTIIKKLNKKIYGNFCCPKKETL